MRVIIEVEFEVEQLEASFRPMSKDQAQGAAEEAAAGYLVFCEDTGSEIELPIDGVGRCKIMIPD